MGLEGAHTEFLGQGKGLLVVGFGLPGLRRITTGGDLAKEPQSIGFLAPFLVGSGELKSILCLGIRLFQLAGEQIRLSQMNDCQGMLLQEVQGRILCDRPFQELHGLPCLPGQGIGGTEGRADPVVISRQLRFTTDVHPC